MVNITVEYKDEVDISIHEVPYDYRIVQTPKVMYAPGKFTSDVKIGSLTIELYFEEIKNVV